MAQPVDPKEAARQLAALTPGAFAVDEGAARQRLAARVLDQLRGRLRPLPEPAELLAQVLSLGEALGLLGVTMELVALDEALGEAVGRAWTARVEELAAAEGMTPADAAGIAFEDLLARGLRRLGAELLPEDLIRRPAAGEVLVRTLCQSLGVPTRLGARVESDAQRQAALERLDPAETRRAARRVAYERRRSSALAQLNQDLGSGGAIPEQARYRRL